MQDGYVYTSDSEIAAMAEHLGISVREFWKRFEVRVDLVTERPVFEAKDQKGCPLLDPDRGCSVHPVKPIQCATWPFWPEMLRDRTEWAAAKSFCPGLDRDDGRRYTRAEILEIRDEKRGT
jgi:Fe-S-cluster containining protein